MRSDHSAEPLWTRVTAAVVALAFMLGVTRLMLQVPALNTGGEQTRVQLRWLSPDASTQDLAVPQPTITVAPGMPMDSKRAPSTSPASDTAAPAVPAAPAATAAAPQAAWSQRLYGKDGTLAIPDATDTHQKSAAERVFEHRDELATQVGERATANLFSGERAGTRQKRSERLLYGEDIQAAEARRPPDIAFNPRLHERPSDLGSEATGDAYKAAPIRYEKAPDMKGEASRRIRVAIGALEQRYPRCNADQRRRWLGIAQQHLEALQRVEYRYNNGADPVEAEHSLRSAADSAYDLARRALWDAERRMKMCT